MKRPVCVCSGFFLFFFNGEWVSGADAGLREKEMRWG